MHDTSAKLDPNLLNPENFCGSGLKVHPLADLFPMIAGKEFEELCLDIQSSGLLQPIVVLNGVLLDGRNRLRACAKLGVQPKYADYAWYKNRESEWIISQNLHRRSITPDQRAALVAKYYDWREAEERARLAKLANIGTPSQQKARKHVLAEGPAQPAFDTRAVIATASGTSEKKARQVIFIAKNKPELLNDVLSGKRKLVDAERIAREAVGELQAKRDAWNIGKEVQRFAKYLEATINKAPTNFRSEFRQALRRVAEDLCQ